MEEFVTKQSITSLVVYDIKTTLHCIIIKCKTCILTI